jgi:hypothetical protein
MTAIIASILPNGKAQFIDQNGVPLVGGKVYFYIPNTSTPSNTWQNPSASILNTNPVILDSRGQALIYGAGQYRQVVQDSLGNTIWDQLTEAPGDVTLGTAQTITNRKYFNLSTSLITNNDGINAAIRNLRDASGTTGGTATVLNAGLYTQSNSGATETASEVGLLSVLNNNSASASVTNAAIYAQGIKNGTAPTWGMYVIASDLSGDNTNPLCGMEVDILANGTNSTENRFGLAIYTGKANSGGADSTCYAGLYIESKALNNNDSFLNGIIVGDSHARSFGTPLTCNIAMHVYTNGGTCLLDTGTKTNGIYLAATYSGSAIRLQDDSSIAYEHTQTITSKYNTSSTNIEFYNGSTLLYNIAMGGTPWVVGALVHQTAPQTVPNNTTTALTFGASTYNNHTCWAIGNPTRLTVPANVSYIKLCGNVQFASVTAPDAAFVLLFIKNGGASTYGASRAVIIGGANAELYELNISSPPIPVSPGDYFELNVVQQSGGNLDTNYTSTPFGTWFAMEIVQ